MRVFFKWSLCLTLMVKAALNFASEPGKQTSDIEPADKNGVFAKVILNDLEWNDENLIFKVVSHGCTKSNDFKLIEHAPLDFEVVRSKRDYCRKRGYLVTIVIPWSSLGPGLMNEIRAVGHINLRNRLSIFRSKNIMKGRGR